MSRRLLHPMPDAITAPQRDASDPGRSVWVTANAGSGKTYVLTARVLRLLLSGVRPDEILCLTYTRAAAAEMRGRVAERLARWALADGDTLAADLVALNGRAPGAGELLRARTLFAHALETPGGLRIQTIHAFCEAVLHRFPREAGVPFDFSVLEEHERDILLREAREAVIAAGLRGGGEAAAVETLFDMLSDFQIETAIVEALGQQRLLRDVLADRPSARRALHDVVGPVGSVADVLAEMSSGYGLGVADHEAIRAAASGDGRSDFTDLLAAVDPRRPDPESLVDAFLTGDRTVRKTLLKKAVARQLPDLDERVKREGERIEWLYGRLTAARLLERSLAMLDVVAAISAHYERAKRARSLLDFDDLVEALATLLRNPEHGDWVRYKLDAGLSHILVDEGQDTNLRQWQVIGALIDEFFVGDSAVDRPRTLFAVGDQKQSIFSFQGAEPEEFVHAGRQYAFSARAAHGEVSHIPLRYSFRTLPAVLKAVDLTFEPPDMRAAALNDWQLHDTARAEDGGMVTLWPPTRGPEDAVETEDWPTEPPLVATQSAQRQLAERIAREIRSWLDTGRPLGPRGRAVRANDILILVQVRSVLFHEIIRALNGAGIPTPGADRLAVTTHLGVLDLMALGDVLNSPADDLQLAALLRSPLFDVSEEDLLALAQPRPDREWLWRAMETSPIPSVRDAHQRLSAWRDRLDFERPFNFYTDVLYAGGGLKRMRARFGAEIDDVVAEFLDLALQHEQSEQPSLIGFLAELRSREVIIKRELAEGGAGVRVMTVHGAKGLEAPIVILADAATTERGRDRRSVFMGTAPPIFIHASSNDTHIPATRDGFKVEAEAAQRAEYWRKLYVAMTRAEDELYITGYLTKIGTTKDSWYEAVEQALAPLSETVRDPDETITALLYPAERPVLVPSAPAQALADAAAGAHLPKLPAYAARTVIRPSMVEQPADRTRILATNAEVAVDPETARREGTALHALLQHLTRIAHTDRPAVAARALEALLPAHPDRHGALAAKALSLLSRPELAGLFGASSRAEIPFFAEAIRRGEPVRLIGRVDRLVVEPGRVLVVDFKSDSSAPETVENVPASYLTQLGLYALVAARLFPGRAVEAAILWTGPETLMILPTERLRAAAPGFTIN